MSTASDPSSRRTPTMVTPTVLRVWPLPGPGSDKEARGRVLVVGGSRATPGAIVLAAEAALRTGAGKLQVATVESLAPHVAMALPEAAVFGLPETSGGDIASGAAGRILELAESAAALLIGPGMMDVDAASELGAAVLPGLRCTTLVDALALAALPSCSGLPSALILTPNRKELALALDVAGEEVDADPAEMTVRHAERTGAVVCSGGPTSWVAGPDEGLWEVESGGPGLAVSGSGDVQGGVLLGLSARGATPTQAAAWGAYLHGRAGDRLAAAVGGVGFLARELPAQIPLVLSEIEV